MYFSVPRAELLAGGDPKNAVVVNGEYTLKLTTDHFARGVYVNFTNSDATLSGNYFDLLPGEMRQINIRSKASLARN